MFSHFLRKIWPFGSRPSSGVHRAGVRVWHLTADAAAVLGPAGPDLERWIADGSAVVVKTNPQRTVYRVTLPGGTVYVKHCRVRGFRAWAREVLRPAKARLEFENAQELQARGIPTVVPLAWGGPDTRRPGESFLVTLDRDGAVPFAEFTERGFTTLPASVRAAVRRQLARALGEFFAHMHDAGVAHPDPHPGNLLLELPPGQPPRFALLDLHAVRLGQPLSWAESRANLAVFNRWFQLRATRADRLRFWHAYRRSRQTLPAPTPQRSMAQAREVERRTTASNLRFWSGRVSRCLGTNRYFRRVRIGEVRGFAVRDLPDGVIAELLANPDAIFARAGVTILKDSRTSTVARFSIATTGNPRLVVFKRVNVRRWVEPLKNLFRSSPVLRSWIAGHAMRDRWLPTPRPLAVVHRYRRGLPCEGYLLTELVPDAIELSEAVNAAAPGSRLTADWIHGLARVIRAMHDRAVSHRDLKAPNVLLQGAAIDPAAASPVLIDLVGVRVGAAVRFRQRVRELARLNASSVASRVISHGDRLRFLQAYLAAGPEPGQGWRVWWRAVARATAAKVARNQRTGRPLA